jgi:membrane dipeptidase
MAANQPADPSIIVDAHLDIAFNNSVFGRDFTLSAYRKRQLEATTDIPSRNGTATVGLPELLLGRVGVAFATLFVSPAFAAFAGEPGYETPAEAHKLAMKQVDYYYRLADENDRIVLVRTQRDLDNVLATWADGVEFEKHKVGLVLLMEGADPVREPRAFEEWYERGVRVVGLAWSETRYSGGTGRPGPLTDMGRELLQVLASYHAVLDLSHAAEEAFLEAVDRYEGPIIASHSNPRHFCNTDRHLTDDMIRRLAERDGVMGAVLLNGFMWTGRDKTDPKVNTPLSRYLDIIDHICQVTGSARYVGIGTDADGGFGYERIPAELDTVADLGLIGAGLKARGYSSDDIKGILGGNFLRVLRTALPV